jgi:trehalose 6-phosphate phosphatase
VSETRLRFLTAEPASTGLFFDFDGTLSAVTQKAEEARPIAGAAELLAALSERFALVAVVSGRAAAQVLTWLGPQVEIWGAHGAQHVVDGRVELAPELLPYREVMSEVLKDAQAAVEQCGIEGIRVEDKTVIVGLHYRPAEDRQEAEKVVRAIAADIVQRHEVWSSPSKMAVELKPPVELSKSKVVLQRGHDLHLTAACYTGDDVVDLSAFDALDELAGEGMHVARIAVDSDEAPSELIERADIVVDGPSGVLDLFGSLV